MCYMLLERLPEPTSSGNETVQTSVTREPAEWVLWERGRREQE